MLTIDWNLLFTIINLLILYVLMKKFLYKPVMNIMEQREQMINSQLENARKAEEEANQLKQTWETNMADIEAEKERIMEKARLKTMEDYKNAITNANKEASKIIDIASKKIEAEKEKAIHDVESQVAGIAMLAAAKIVNVKSANMDNNAMYDEFLAKKK